MSKSMAMVTAPPPKVRRRGKRMSQSKALEMAQDADRAYRYGFDTITKGNDETIGAKVALDRAADVWLRGQRSRRMGPVNPANYSAADRREVRASGRGRLEPYRTMPRRPGMAATGARVHGSRPSTRL